jgi:hypothetical protein
VRRLQINSPLRRWISSLIRHAAKDIKGKNPKHKYQLGGGLADALKGVQLIGAHIEDTKTDENTDQGDSIYTPDALTNTVELVSNPALDNHGKSTKTAEVPVPSRNDDDTKKNPTNDKNQPIANPKPATDDEKSKAEVEEQAKADKEAKAKLKAEKKAKAKADKKAKALAKAKAKKEDKERKAKPKPRRRPRQKLRPMPKKKRKSARPN